MYFQEYLNLGAHRSLKKTSDKVGLKSDYLKKLSMRWRWVERVAAKDKADRDEIAARLLQREWEFYDRNSRQGEAADGVIQAALSELINLARAGETLEPGQLIRLMEVNSKNQRELYRQSQTARETLEPGETRFQRITEEMTPAERKQVAAMIQARMAEYVGGAEE